MIIMLIIINRKKEKMRAPTGENRSETFPPIIIIPTCKTLHQRKCFQTYFHLIYILLWNDLFCLGLAAFYEDWISIGGPLSWLVLSKILIHKNTKKNNYITYSANFFKNKYFHTYTSFIDWCVFINFSSIKE